MSILEEDGFVLVSKDGLGEGAEDDVASVSSSKSSLCVVEDPLDAAGLLSDDEGQQDEPAKAKLLVDEAGPTDGAAKPHEELEAAPAEQQRNSKSPGRKAAPAKHPKYVCSSCSTDVAVETAVVWEGFMGANKSALLFEAVLNTEATAEPRKQQLSTGLFLLQDVRCRTCSAPFGWTYLKAWSEDQKYKEGTTIVQRSLLRLEQPAQTQNEA